jgi:ATP phosphoribosyltransferase regulatory subunit
MSNWKKHIPDGTRDILFHDCVNKIKIDQAFRNVYISRGFHEIITPTLEFYDVFNGEKDWIEQEHMYKLFDNSGRILVLRPDLTTPIARIAGTKLRDSYYPLRLCYSSNVFRTNESWNGKKNEFTQSGVELIGIDNFRADVEVLITAIEALLQSGVSNFKVELGQIQFFKGMIEDLSLQEEELERLRSYIENKNFGALKDFLQSRAAVLGQSTIEALNSLPKLFGGIEVIEEGRKITKNKKALEALDNIENIYSILENMGLSKYISVDLGMVHHIDYYTGLIFRGYIEGAGDDVLYGGRYDSLIKRFGVDAPATGFAINVDSVVEVLNKQGLQEKSKNADYLLYYTDKLMGSANVLSEEIRKGGYICELSLFESLESTVEYAVRKKIKKVLIIEQDNIYEYDVEKEVQETYSGLEGRA